MEWADARIWKAVLDVPALQGDLEMRGRLNHIHTTQWVYLQMWRGEAMNVPELSSFADLRSVGRWARGYYRELPTFLDGLTESALEGPVAFPWAAELEKRFGAAEPATLAESMLQIVLHTAHHRAQLATRLRQAGSDPPMVDFIAWIWMHRPAPEWSDLGAA